MKKNKTTQNKFNLPKDKTKEMKKKKKKDYPNTKHNKRK